MTPRGPYVVVDTNVWISGMLTRTGTPAQLVRSVLSQARPVLTTETFAELRQRLWLPKFDRYVSMEARKLLLHDLDASAFWFEVPQHIAAQKFCRDADDDKFIHAALASAAAWLVTGDRDLLDLADGLAASGVRVVSPAQAILLPDFDLHN